MELPVVPGHFIAVDLKIAAVGLRNECRLSAGSHSIDIRFSEILITSADRNCAVINHLNNIARAQVHDGIEPLDGPAEYVVRRSLGIETTGDENPLPFVLRKAVVAGRE